LVRNSIRGAAGIIGTMAAVGFAGVMAATIS
jgi:hypothetical protein